MAKAYKPKPSIKAQVFIDLGMGTFITATIAKNEIALIKTRKKTSVTVGSVPTTNSMKKKELPQHKERLNNKAQVTGFIESEAWFKVLVLSTTIPP